MTSVLRAKGRRKIIHKLNLSLFTRFCRFCVGVDTQTIFHLTYFKVVLVKKENPNDENSKPHDVITCWTFFYCLFVDLRHMWVEERRLLLLIKGKFTAIGHKWILHKNEWMNEEVEICWQFPWEVDDAIFGDKTKFIN